MGSELPTTLVWELSKVSSRMSRRRFDHVLTKKALAEICKLKTILFFFPPFPFSFQNHSTNLRIRSFRDFAIDSSMCCFTIRTVKQHIEEHMLERKFPLRIGTKMHSHLWKLHFAMANVLLTAEHASLWCGSSTGWGSNWNSTVGTLPAFWPPAGRRHSSLYAKCLKTVSHFPLSFFTRQR